MDQDGFMIVLRRARARYIPQRETQIEYPAQSHRYEIFADQVYDEHSTDLQGGLP